MKLVLAALAAAVVVAASATVATAAPASHSGASAATSLCSVARDVAKSLVRVTSVQDAATATPATLRANWTKIVAAEPRLLRAASGSMKTNLRKVFGFVNVFVADLKQANWHVAGLGPKMPSLVAYANRVEPQLNAVKTYFRKTCKFAV